MVRKPLVYALGASLALHGLSLSPAGLSLWRQRSDSAPIEISYIRLLEAPAAPMPVQKTYPRMNASKPARSAAEQRPEARSVERADVRARPAQAPAAARPQTPVAPAADPVRALRSSADVLADPVKGKVFVHYFTDVKRRIQQVVRRKYDGTDAGEGRVALYFIVDATGRLDAVTVVSAETQADPALRELAKKCVREAAPFEPFPGELRLERVSFNLSIQFEAS